MQNKSYERPRIESVPASRILESLGPVSCGSGGNHDHMVPGQSTPLSSGDQQLGRN